MKMALLTVALLVIIGLGVRRVEAQAYYDPYYYAPYPDGAQYPVQEAYPYYQLEALHYQIYVPYLQWHPAYPFYQPCCIAAPVVVAPAPVRGRPGPAVVSPRVIRRR